MNSEKNETENQLAIITMFFKTIIINGMKEELTPKEIIQNIWIQCEEFLQDTDLNLKFPEGYPEGYIQDCMDHYRGI